MSVINLCELVKMGHLINLLFMHSSILSIVMYGTTISYALQIYATGT